MKALIPAVAVATALSACKATSDVHIDTDRPSRTFRFVYEAAVDEVPPDAKDLRLWIPLPQDTTDQRVRNVELVLHGPDGKTLRAHSDDTGGLQRGALGDQLSWVARDFERGEGRSICIETHGEPVSAQVSYDVTRFETTGGGGADPEELDRLLEPNAMIPRDGKVARIAAGLKTPAQPMDAARVLYDHVLATMNYDKPEGGGWGRGDAEWACDSGYGNCTDFHSYFMGLARAKGIPARFEMGFPVAAGDEPEAKIGGYHCWAFFWAGESGWVPVDISEADKHPEKTDYFFGTLDADRFTMTGGRDLLLDPRPAQGALNYFVYPYAEVDGQAWSKVSKAFRRLQAGG